MTGAPANVSGVISDRFELLWELHGTDLQLSIDTALPDSTEVRVLVDRRYFEVGSDSAYSRDYFSERSHISEWRTPRSISVDPEAWKADLLAFQTKMARLGAHVAFEVDRIDDVIGVSAVVQVKQAGGNNWNTIKAEKDIPMPLVGELPEVRAVAFDDLQEGRSYRIQNEVPLMAVHPQMARASNYRNTMTTIEKTVYLPAGRVVRVVSVDKSSQMFPWYGVEVIGTDRMVGWINSTVLMRSGVIAE